MSRRFAEFSRPRPAAWRWTDTLFVGLGSLIVLVAFAFMLAPVLHLRFP